MADVGSEEPTQQATQQAVDPRRRGHNSSGLHDEDISDVICILHPASTAAVHITAVAASAHSQHVLQGGGRAYLKSEEREVNSLSEIDKMLALPTVDSRLAPDLALRFSSNVCDITSGFIFGRHKEKCDVNLDPDNSNKKVSNVHFRIYINPLGVMMLEDSSTNGTVVDNITLGGRKTQGHHPKSRMIQNHSIVQILSSHSEEWITFIVRIPNRDGYIEPYRHKFQRYIERVAAARKMQPTENRALQAANIPQQVKLPLVSAPLLGPNQWSGFGKYRAISVIGKGAFATVWHVANEDTGEVYAAKELERKYFAKQGQLDVRINNEMEIMKNLRHPNIIQYIDFNETPTHMYIFMEYALFGDITSYIEKNKTMPEYLAKQMTCQILDALSYLHQKGVTHRDIKPDNILIWSLDPFVTKLTDFGLSKVVTDQDTFLKTFCGTLLYCAPEVFPHFDRYASISRQGQKRARKESRTLKDRQYNHKIDVWSYATVLWYVLVGTPPFEGVVDANGKAMFKRIMESPLDVDLLRTHGISEAAIDMLIRMLDRDPACRPAEDELFRHPWLRDVAHYRTAVATLDEEDEIDASQLKLDDDLSDDDAYGEVSVQIQPDKTHNQSAMSLFKRLKPSTAAPHAPPPLVPIATPAPPAPTLRRYQPLTPEAHAFVPEHVHPTAPLHGNKLFGEISQRALKSSGALGNMFAAAQVIQQAQSQPSHDEVWRSADLGRYSNDIKSRPNPLVDSSLGLMSKDGAPDGHHAVRLDTPTPKSSANGGKGGLFAQEQTPKAVRTLEDGLNKVASSRHIPHLDGTEAAEIVVLGRLRSTSDSFYQEQIDLTSRITTWGRNPSNTHVYPDDQDVRVPKIAFEIRFQSPKLFGASRSEPLMLPNSSGSSSVNTSDNCTSRPTSSSTTTSGKFITEANNEVSADELSQCPDLQAFILTQSSSGIWINGVHLPRQDADGKRCYGKLQHKDDILVSTTKGRDNMKFKVEIYHGKSKRPRAHDQPFTTLSY